jgi:hypothetical protein
MSLPALTFCSERIGLHFRPDGDKFASRRKFTAVPTEKYFHRDGNLPLSGQIFIANPYHVIANAVKQSRLRVACAWIASSFLLAMTKTGDGRYSVFFYCFTK